MLLLSVGRITNDPDTSKLNSVMPRVWNKNSKSTRESLGWVKLFQKNSSEERNILKDSSTRFSFRLTFGTRLDWCYIKVNRAETSHTIVGFWFLSNSKRSFWNFIFYQEGQLTWRVKPQQLSWVTQIFANTQQILCQLRAHMLVSSRRICGIYKDSWRNNQWL